VKNKRAVKRVILYKLYEHLQETYGIDWSRDTFTNGTLTLHQLDALLAFKHDGMIDELWSALKRLDAGEFGLCIRCKKEVSDVLLEKDPTRRICSECEAEFSHASVPLHAVSMPA